VAESYNAVTRRWRSSYPETTGYIICSLLRAADAGFDPNGKLVHAAQRMGAWLTTVQLESGAFPGGTVDLSSRKAAVFNTGQIVKGFTDLLARGFDRSGEIAPSTRRAVDWMVKIQDDDGCWRQGSSTLTTAPIHSYNVRAAWALARYGLRLGDTRAIEAAVANARWVCRLQSEDGWFEHMSFDLGVPPLTHTIAYTLQGLMEIGAITATDEFIDRTARGTRAMYRLQNAETGAFPGQCAERWQPVGQWTSNTGNAQMAIVGHRLASLTGDTWFSRKARLATEFCRRLQEMDHRDLGRRGAVRGSYPGHRGYGRFWYMNWTQKFYLDALLAECGTQIT